jgi:Holliday junction resolvase RusA-like endonuclease
MTQRDTWKQRPSVLRYRAWCDLLRGTIGWRGKRTLTHPVRLSLECHLPCPASWSFGQRVERTGDPHTAKPDLDNLVKGVMDALLDNDAYVTEIHATKYWTMGTPHVSIVMEAL